MEVFSVTRNPLGGSIPDTLGQWNNLREFHSSGCGLSGTIPYFLYNISLLINITLAYSNFTGSLPPTMGAMLPRLVRIRLWGNQLTGPLPLSISNCSRLAYLDMGGNKFSGKMAIDFAKLRDIYYIRLSYNLFGSKEDDELKFIDSLKNCTSLKWLLLHKCKFQGMLPTSIGNLSNNLQDLYLYGNQLHENLPGSIGNLVGLKRLHLQGNHFKGNIPSTIGNLRNLQVVYLYKN
ncbi:putative non-specific serine/threonine protein kinase [Helianthus anomalus]